jgi:hypothetical protein
MSSLNTFFRIPASSDYLAVAPHSPEADATFIDTLSFSPFETNGKEASQFNINKGKQWSRSSYVSKA